MPTFPVCSDSASHTQHYSRVPLNSATCHLINARVLHAGAAATAGVLVAGLFAFKQGNQKLSQQMMRTRVLFQGITVGIMAGTSGYYALTAPAQQS